MHIAETIKFKVVCNILEKVKNGENVAKKEKYLRRYYLSFIKHRENYRQQHNIPLTKEEDGNSSFYCILRCLIPGADYARKVYGLQITSLAKIYIKILQLAPDSNEAIRLQARTYNGIYGDYADIVQSVLRPRCRREPSNLNLQQIHEMLDVIADDDRRNTEKVLTQLSEVASVEEQTWFIRLVLKSMRLGIGEQRIFAILHPQAKQLFQHCSNLSRVCNLIMSTSSLAAAISSAESSTLNQLNIKDAVKPFQHLSPMLCEIFPGNLAPILESDVLYMETKMDGERFHLHFADERFQYISRNGNDFTYSFGNTYETGNLTPLLKDLLPNEMKTIILDGEMMVWDERQQKFRDKGENTDVKHLSNRSNWRPCYVIYDILYYNGENLLNVPYVDRIKKIPELIKEKRGVLHIMKPKKIESMKQFKILFQRALDYNEEGVVLKKANSIYIPGVRQNGGWYKVKADYILGLTTEFDLIIMGGFYNRTKTFVESFLVGVMKGAEPNFEFYSVGKVTNITRQRVLLNATLKPHWHQMASEPPPIWFHYCAKSAEGSPDVWIQPQNSEILQIKAADLAPSSAFTQFKALHFPRIVAWRSDKLWNECMTLVEYEQMMQNKSGIKKINKRQISEEDFMTDRKKQKITPAQKRKLAIQAYEMKFDANLIEKFSTFLDGFSFCILSGSSVKGITVEGLKALVVRNGGEIVENPIFTNPKCMVVAGDINFRVKTLQKTQRYNIVSMDWLIKSCTRQQLQLAPRDMISMTPAQKEQFDESYDQYGDSYTEPVTAVELEEIFDNITEDELNKVSLLDIDDVEKILPDHNSFEYFYNEQGYFYSNEPRMQMAKLTFEWLGGVSIASMRKQNIISNAVIFINLEPNRFDGQKFKAWLNQSFKNVLKQLKIVNIYWIIHSHRAKRKLDMFEYTWHDF